MDYLYNKKNILEFPEKYMYTKFYGYSFIDSFSKDRKKLINSLKIKRSEFFIKDEKVFHLFSLVKKNIFFSSDLEKKIIACYKNNENKNNKSNFDMQKFSIERDLRIQELLNSLFFSIKSKKNILKNKLFLEHLVQRFEVTKKIYKKLFTRF